MIIIRQIIKDLIIQFLSFLMIINMILVVSQVVRLAEIVVAFGITFENTVLPLLFMIAPMLSYTIPIAFFFSVLTVVARMCMDGEYTALLASGLSLRKLSRALFPVSIFVFIFAVVSATYLESWGRRELMNFIYQKTQTELDNIIRNKLQPGVFYEDFLGYVIYAETISKDRKKLGNVLLAPKSKAGEASFTLFAPSGSIKGSVQTGDLTLILDDSYTFSGHEASRHTTTVEFKHSEVDLLRMFPQRVFGESSANFDYRSYGPVKLYDYVKKVESKGVDKRNKKNYLRAKYLFHQRFGGPFSIIVFSMFALIIGITDTRKGKSSGYYWAIFTIINTYVLIMGFKWLAEQGYMEASWAVWIPNLILYAIAKFLLFQKNRLPISEPILARKNLPTLMGVDDE